MFDRTTCWQEGWRRVPEASWDNKCNGREIGWDGVSMENMRNKQPWNRLHTSNSSIDQRDTAKQKALRQDALNTLAGVITLLPATALR